MTYDPNDPCVFCHHDRLDNKAYLIAAEPINVYATKPREPVVPGHVLVFPALHVMHASDMTVITGYVFQAAAAYARQNMDEYNIITSKGRAATQSVDHLHVHLVPRTEGDGLLLPWSRG